MGAASGSAAKVSGVMVVGPGGGKRGTGGRSMRLFSVKPGTFPLIDEDRTRAEAKGGRRDPQQLRTGGSLRPGRGNSKHESANDPRFPPQRSNHTPAITRIPFADSTARNPEMQTTGYSGDRERGRPVLPMGDTPGDAEFREIR